MSWAVVGFAPLLQESHQCAKDPVQGGSQSHLSGCTREVGRGQRHMMYQTIVRSKLHYGYIVYGTASITNL